MSELLREVRKFKETAKGRTPVHRNSFRDIKKVYLELTAPDRAEKTRREIAKDITSAKKIAKEEAKKAEIARIARENGMRLLKIVMKEGYLKMVRPNGIFDVAMLRPGKTIGGAQIANIAEDQRRWALDCKDLLAAAKTSGEHFTWNKNWFDDGELMIYVTSRFKVKKLAK